MNRVKRMFSTPKRAVFTVICIAAALAVIIAGTLLAVKSIAKSSSIGEENAKNFAFADAGVDPLKAERVRAKFDFEDGRFVYEVEFTANGIEYEYLIDSSDGSVIKRESEKDDAAPFASGAGAPDTNAPQTGEAAPPTQITADDAKKTAINDAELSDEDVKFIKSELDFDNGVKVYDIEFYTSDGYEYDYEIDAETGDIYSKSVKRRENNSVTDSAPYAGDGAQDTSNTQSSLITADRAKEIASAHAGFSVSDVVFSKTELERDDGYTVYEIEFYKDGVEYEYKINAENGTVFEYDAERIHD